MRSPSIAGCVFFAYEHGRQRRGQNPGTISRPVLQQIVRDQLAANAGQCAPDEIYDAIHGDRFQTQPEVPDCPAGDATN